MAIVTIFILSGHRITYRHMFSQGQKCIGYSWGNKNYMIFVCRDPRLHNTPEIRAIGIYSDKCKICNPGEEGYEFSLFDEGFLKVETS